MKRSNNCVFLSHCLLAQTVRAEGVAKWEGACTPVVQWCLDNGVNMIQMPCPETNCIGLDRPPKGKKYYHHHEDFRGLCNYLAYGVVERMVDLRDAGRKILCVFCVEFSPACSPNEGSSPYNPKGIFIEELQKEMSEQEIDISFVGVSDRWLKRLDRDLLDLSSRLQDTSFSLTADSHK